MNKKREEKNLRGNKKKVKKKDDNKQEDQSFENIVVDQNVVKDFEFLVKAPVSEDDHFVFKSEKTWSIDVSKYSEYFLVDLKTLSAAIESIPFNENVHIDNKYFTEDQLTKIHNNAERGTQNYKEILDSLDALDTGKTVGTDETEESCDDTMENLDYLLSLQEPVARPSLIVKPVPTSHSSSDVKPTTKPTSSKPIDLENWLDSLLDD